MPPLHPLRLPVALLCLLTACSTPISPYSPLEELEEEEEDQDGGTQVDAGSDPGRDAGPRDAGRNDAAAPDAGGGGLGSCLRITMADSFGSLLDDDCTSRRIQACAATGQSAQTALNQRLSTAVARCGGPANATFGVTFGALGCPSFYGFVGAGLQGRVSRCVQAEAETWRFDCMPSCAVTGAFAR